MLKAESSQLTAGFTLVETLVAISLLSIAIVAPMELTVQSLSSAYFSRDQITAYYLAQEAIESVRHIRDGNILLIAQGNSGINIFNGITTDGTPFTIDARTDATQACGSSGCPPLDTNGTLYGYDSTWKATYFTRTVTACYIQPGTSDTCNSTPSDEARITVIVTWQTGSYKKQTFTISENMYRWVQDGSGV